MTSARCGSSTVRGDAPGAASTRLAYGDSARNIFWKSANNTGMPELLAAAPTHAGSGDPNPYFFTPDGTAIVFREPLNPKTGENIGRVAVKTGRAMAASCSTSKRCGHRLV